MNILSEKELSNIKFSHSVCTIGNFDGVHHGHQAILRLVRDHAVTHGGGDGTTPGRVVITFDPHPRAVLAKLRGETSPALLTLFKRKVQLLANEGMDTLVRVNFTDTLARMQPEDFINEIVLPLNPLSLIVGHDFSFGRGGRGTAALLREIGVDKGFEVTQVPAVLHDDMPISSSRIRDLLAAGEIMSANEMIGRSHAIIGKVVKGNQRGKGIGFPTVNVEWGAQMLPGNGVYVGQVEVDENVHGAMINIGVKPTFGESELTLEAHIFDFNSDVYGQDVLVSFLRRYRDERPFASVDELIKQLKKDEQAVRGYLNSVGKDSG